MTRTSGQEPPATSASNASDRMMVGAALPCDTSAVTQRHWVTRDGVTRPDRHFGTVYVAVCGAAVVPPDIALVSAPSACPFCLRYTSDAL